MTDTHAPATQASSDPPSESPRPRGRRTSGRFDFLVSFIGFAIVLVVWEAISQFGFVKGVPTPFRVVKALITLFASGQGWGAIGASLFRVVLGVVIGVGLATPVGFLFGWYSFARRAAEPLVNFFRALPPIALIPLVIVYLGIGEPARVFVITLSTFFVSIVVIYEGIRAIDPIYIRAARVLGATAQEIFLKVVVPISVPTLFTAIRLALGAAWATLVAAELIAAQSGLGSVISTAANYFDIPTVYAGVLLIGAFALAMDRLVRFISVKATAWQDSFA